MGNAYTEAEVQSMLNSGELPELPCLVPKALILHGDMLVFVGKKERTSVPIGNISSFSLKKPSFGTNGTIKIQLQKGNDAFVSLGSFGLGFGNELTAVFKPAHLEIAELYERFILNWTSAQRSASNGCMQSESVPTINDLRALKQLVDEGVLTEEEFTAKKRQLLGI